LLIHPLILLGFRAAPFLRFAALEALIICCKGNLFIATGSFFLGQQQVFRAFLRGSVFLTILALLPFPLMIYWVIRVRLGKAYQLRRVSTRCPRLREIANPRFVRHRKAVQLRAELSLTAAGLSWFKGLPGAVTGQVDCVTCRAGPTSDTLHSSTGWMCTKLNSFSTFPLVD
jgi:hypothetical protein